jgi:hypothetical protein
METINFCAGGRPFNGAATTQTITVLDIATGRVTGTHSSSWSLAVPIDGAHAYFTSFGEPSPAYGPIGFSSDRGAHITAIHTVVTGTETPEGFHDIAAFSANDLLLFDPHGDDTDIYASHDGGHTAHLVMTLGNSVPNGVQIINRKSAVIIGPDSTLYRTDDAGDTWHPIGHLPPLVP